MFGMLGVLNALLTDKIFNLLEYNPIISRGKYIILYAKSQKKIKHKVVIVATPMKQWDENGMDWKLEPCL